MAMNGTIKDNINTILNKLREAEKKYGRPEGSVKLLAVSKFNPKEAVYEAIEAGQTSFGENRVQEVCEKFPEILEKHAEVKLHIIGQLQTNKVKKAVLYASMIESVDRLELIQEIEKQCAKINKNIEILLEYHTGEESKSGFTSEEELSSALQYIADGNAPHVIPRGFMTMAPFTEDKTLIHNSFATMKKIAEKMQKAFPDFNLSELSMGMTNDFEIAVQESSTQVRVGTAIFGARIYN